MADSRQLPRPAQLLALVKELRKVEGAAVRNDREQPADGVNAPTAHEREHHSGSILGGSR